MFIVPIYGKPPCLTRVSPRSRNPLCSFCFSDSEPHENQQDLKQCLLACLGRSGLAGQAGLEKWMGSRASERQMGMFSVKVNRFMSWMQGKGQGKPFLPPPKQKTDDTEPNCSEDGVVLPTARLIFELPAFTLWSMGPNNGRGRQI